MEPEIVKMLAAALTVALGGIIPSWGESHVAGKAMDAMSRNPESADQFFKNAVVLMAVIESVAIYCLVVALIILFVL